MNDCPPPPKVALAAETDQAMALFRDKRGTLTGFDGELATILAGGMADQITAEFGPGHGRIVMAIMQALGAVEKVMREDHNVTMPVMVLLTIGGLAAANLEEAAS